MNAGLNQDLGRLDQLARALRLADHASFLATTVAMVEPTSCIGPSLPIINLSVDYLSHGSVYTVGVATRSCPMA
jgi:hypothetical protein